MYVLIYYYYYYFYFFGFICTHIFNAYRLLLWVLCSLCIHTNPLPGIVVCLITTSPRLFNVFSAITFRDEPTANTTYNTYYIIICVYTRAMYTLKYFFPVLIPTSILRSGNVRFRRVRRRRRRDHTAEWVYKYNNILCQLNCLSFSLSKHSFTRGPWRCHELRRILESKTPVAFDQYAYIYVCIIIVPVQ